MNTQIMQSKYTRVVDCPHCGTPQRFWRSSGMGNMSPHFYCTDCSNVLFRRSDCDIDITKMTEERLDALARSLPNCSCGGQFRPGQNPKCGACGKEFAHQHSALVRLLDPYVIVMEGATLFGEAGPEWTLKISP